MKTAPSNPVLPPVIALAPARRACESSGMNRARHLACACSLALLLGAFTAPAQSSRTNNPAPSAPAKSSAKQSTSKQSPAPAPLTGTFDDFKTIPDRNIFNTRRYAGRTASDTPTPPRRERVIESFSLLGTLEYEKGRVAFFEGTSSSMKKSAKVDETIGDCKITAIESSAVTLEANGKPVQLKVGYMLRREDQGEWQAREAERPYESGYSSGYSSGSSFSSPFGGSSFNSRSSGSSFNSRDSRSSSSNSRDSRSSSSSSFFNSRDPRSSSPFGNESPADSAQRRIREQDRNGDGKISRDEADSRLRPNFDLMDRNRDNIVDADEYTAYYAQRSGGGSSTPSTSGGSFNSGSSFNQGPSSFNSGGSFNNSGSPGSFSSGSSGSSGNTSSSGGSSSGSTSSGGGESDLLRRLMEQRARENR